ncbi:MAG: hypothetical protein RUMPE_01250 [Eubacteriales bacterium SKADARSKE-1]|nr:hypothetical protein [Eubacteriales bacterium SKADARSKE-1]
MVNNYVYLEPPDNEDAAVYKCEHCGNLIFEGDKYFKITGEDALRALFTLSVFKVCPSPGRAGRMLVGGNKMTFGEGFKELKLKASVTQKELASKIEAGLSRCNMWEHGSSPKQETLCKLTNYFNATTDYLLGNYINKYKTKEASDVLIEKKIEI